MTDATPRLFFSVLVAGRNCRPFVRECIASIRAQTFPSWECLVLDDASTDGTYDEIVAAVDGDPRFRLFRTEERQTALPNLMRLIREARGDVVAIVDLDDYLIGEHALDIVYRVYEDAPLVVATSGSYKTEQRVGHVRPLAVGEDWFQSWPFGHLLTWKRQLSLDSFERDPRAYIDPETGDFYKSTYDLALFYPIVYRSEEDGTRIAHIGHVLYEYRRWQAVVNGEQVGNDDACDLRLQSLCARKIQLYYLNLVYKRDMGMIV